MVFQDTFDNLAFDGSGGKKAQRPSKVHQSQGVQ
jgi:hypothetical protein